MVGPRDKEASNVAEQPKCKQLKHSIIINAMVNYMEAGAVEGMWLVCGMSVCVRIGRIVMEEVIFELRGERVAGTLSLRWLLTHLCRHLRDCWSYLWSRKPRSCLTRMEDVRFPQTKVELEKRGNVWAIWVLLREPRPLSKYEDEMNVQKQMGLCPNRSRPQFKVWIPSIILNLFLKYMEGVSPSPILTFKP